MYRRCWSNVLAVVAIVVGVAGPLVAQEADTVSSGVGSIDSDSAGPVLLDELVVTASGFEQKRIQAPASITVLPRAVVSEQRTTSLAELLSTVEGIDVGDQVGKTGGMSIRLRGMPADYTLILIDGRRQNAAGNVTPNGFGDTSGGFFPPLSMIERVEVIRGPMSTLYGSDAMGGVVNIITRRVGDRWSGTVSTDATVQENRDFGDVYVGEVALAGPLVEDRLGLMVRGRLHHRRPSELDPTGGVDGEVEISRRGPSPVEADLYSFGGRLTFSPTTAHDLWLEVDRSRQRYDNSEGQLGTLDRPDASPPLFPGYGPEQRFHRDQLTLAHTWRFRRGVWESSLMRNTTSTLGRTIPEGTPGGPPGSGAPEKVAGSPRALESRSVVFDTKAVRDEGSHTLSVGGQLWGSRMIDGIALEPFESTQWSLFLEDEWALHPAFTLTLGVRRDDHSAFGGNLSPRGYLVWNAAPDWTFKGGVSRGYKTPRVEQLVDGVIGFRGQGTIAVIGTPELEPERSTTTELGAHYSTTAGLSVALSVFDNRFSDKIAEGTPIPNCSFELAPDREGCVDYGDFPEQETFSQNVNVDEAVTRGVEANLAAPLGEIVTVSGNYTYTWSEQRSGENRGMPLTNTPRHILNGSARATMNDELSGWLRAEYRSARARRTTREHDPAYDALGDYKPYALFHLGGSYELRPGTTVSATVYNILDKDFLRYAPYPVEPTPENPDGVLYTSVYNNHQEGRRLWLSVRTTF